MFSNVDAALERAFRRLDSFSANVDRLAWHAIKVIVSFAMMERRQLPVDDFRTFVAGLPFAIDLNARYLALPPDELARRVESELLRAGALSQEDGNLLSA